MQTVIDFLGDVLKSGGILSIMQINQAMHLKTLLEKESLRALSDTIVKKEPEHAFGETQRKKQA